jgi:hypothetical protein
LLRGLLKEEKMLKLKTILDGNWVIKTSLQLRNVKTALLGVFILILICVL